MSSFGRRAGSVGLAVALAAATTACAPKEDKSPARTNNVEIAEDTEALNQLRAAGSNLAKPHKIDFYLYFPNEDEAETAAAVIRPLGYTVTVSAGEDEGNWLCLASRTMMPTIEEITVARALFKGLAQLHQGVYGGWNTAIEH